MVGKKVYHEILTYFLWQHDDKGNPSLRYLHKQKSFSQTWNQNAIFGLNGQKIYKSFPNQAVHQKHKKLSTCQFFGELTQQDHNLFTGWEALRISNQLLLGLMMNRTFPSTQ